MESFFELMVRIQFGATALSSGFNAWYFFTYRSPLGRRRVGAAVMAVVSLAMVVESLSLGFILFPRARDGLPWLVAGGLTLAGSLLITGLIGRHRLSGR